MEGIRNLGQNFAGNRPIRKMVVRQSFFPELNFNQGNHCRLILMNTSRLSVLQSINIIPHVLALSEIKSYKHQSLCSI